MKKLTAFLFLFLVSGITAFAQDAPRVEIFGGYSYLRTEENVPVDGLIANPKRDLNGFLVSGTYNLTKMIGITGEYSGHFGSAPSGIVNNDTNVNFQTFLFGPTISFAKGSRISPFGRVLLGGARGNVNPPVISSINETVFALAAGGGVDVKLTDKFTFRPLVADYLLTRFNSTNQNNLRLSTGFVVNLGEQ